MKWISVDDRLPGDWDQVLAWHDWLSSDPQDQPFIIASQCGGRWYTDTDEEHGDVTHWMPLPEPPKEEE